MHTKGIVWMLMLCSCMVNQVFAAEGHGNEIYHAITIETATGLSEQGDNISEWEIEGWLGTDENKLWLKVEGERETGHTEAAETWLMYSRYVATFWDVQLGLRLNTQPETLNHLVFGVHGLAKYFFETDAHLFISEDGDVSARLVQTNEFLITQQWILEPYLEADLYMQDVEALEVGAGLSSAELGVQTRYEFTRQFAPYVDLKYERKLGETADLNDGDDDNFIISLGIRLLL